MNPATFRKLAALGLTTDQIAGVLEIMAADAETRKEKGRERWRKWKKRLNLSASEWRDLSNYIMERDGYACVYCGSRAEPLHVDHRTPLIQGGTNDPDNLATACHECNCGKSGRTVEEWRGEA